MPKKILLYYDEESDNKYLRTGIQTKLYKTVVCYGSRV